jgi:anti-sigma regulatory factor (Ser/Thr protein kinase)
MRVVQHIPIRQESDALFAKISMKNIARSMDQESTFLEMAVMEMATNISKYAKTGHLYILRHHTHILLASLDHGEGIINVELALSKGYTTNLSSLGLGLHILNSADNYTLHIFSQHISKSASSGTVLLLLPKELELDYGFFTIPLDHRGYNGDFFRTFSNRFLFGDAAGHGKGANKTATMITETFDAKMLTHTTTPQFFHDIHHAIKADALHGAVMSVIYNYKESIDVYCVGNITLSITNPQQFRQILFKEGMIGDTMGHIDHQSFPKEEDSWFIFTTDGINAQQMDHEMVSKITRIGNPLLAALAIYNFYKSLRDDNSILVLRSTHASSI